MQIDVIIAVWCLRLIGVIGMITITTVLVVGCLNYIYHSGKHAAGFFRYLVERRKMDQSR